MEDSKKTQFQGIGTAKRDKGQKNLFLKITIPFFPRLECQAIPNEKKEKESHPDMILFFENQRIGSLWQSEDVNGNLYFSGKIFCLASPTSFFPIFLFFSKEKELWEIKLPINSGSDSN